jgi:hypothetical protein
MAALVEFFGLPGSGKSTVTNAIERGPGVHSRHEISKDWRRQSHLRRIGFTLRTLRDVPLMLAALRLARGARLTRRESYGRLLRLVLTKHWWIAQPGMLLLDQGALQSIWSILYASGRTSPRPSHIEAFLREFFDGVAAQIVLLDIDDATAAQRIVDRTQGNSRFDELPLTEVESQLASSIALLRTIHDAGRAAGLNIHRMDGSSPVPMLAGQLLELLSQHAREPIGEVT